MQLQNVRDNQNINSSRVRFVNLKGHSNHYSTYKFFSDTAPKAKVMNIIANKSLKIIKYFNKEITHFKVASNSLKIIKYFNKEELTHIKVMNITPVIVVTTNTMISIT